VPRGEKTRRPTWGAIEILNQKWSTNRPFRGKNRGWVPPRNETVDPPAAPIADRGNGVVHFQAIPWNPGPYQKAPRGYVNRSRPPVTGPGPRPPN